MVVVTSVCHSTKKRLSLYSPKSSKIYRCWIVWDKNTLVVIIPSFLTITYIGQSIYVHLISRFNFQIITSSYLAGVRWRISIWTWSIFSVPWGIMLTLTALATFMVVNTLVTGLIVFNESRCSWKLGLLRSSKHWYHWAQPGIPNFGHIMFIILESGMALFAIQLVRVVITSLVATPVVQTPPTLIALDFVIGIHKMLNAIIIFVDFYFFCFTDSDIY